MTRSEKKQPPCSRQDRATKRERVAQVTKWIQKNRAPSDIVDDGVKMWGCSERAVWNYIAVAKEEGIPKIYGNWGKLRKLAQEKAAQFEQNARDAAAAGDWSAVNAALAKAAEMMGITAPMQVSRLKAENRAALMEAVRASKRDDQTSTDEKTSKRRSLSLDEFNEARAVTGQVPWTEAMWQAYQVGDEGEAN
jgi:hypothetical protein